MTWVYLAHGDIVIETDRGAGLHYATESRITKPLE